MNGTLGVAKDQDAGHAGCPVLGGTKFSANLWYHVGLQDPEEGPLKGPVREPGGTTRISKLANAFYKHGN